MNKPGRAAAWRFAGFEIKLKRVLKNLKEFKGKRFSVLINSK